jgi:hypothetical protein
MDKAIIKKEAPMEPKEGGISAINRMLLRSSCFGGSLNPVGVLCL